MHTVHLPVSHEVARDAVASPALEVPFPAALVVRPRQAEPVKPHQGRGSHPEFFFPAEGQTFLLRFGEKYIVVVTLRDEEVVIERQAAEFGAREIVLLMESLRAISAQLFVTSVEAVLGAVTLPVTEEGRTAAHPAVARSVVACQGQSLVAAAQQGRV